MISLVKFLFRSISAKMLGGLVTMLILFVWAIATFIFLNSEQKYSSIAINECGKLRMLSQRIAKSVLMISEGRLGAREELGTAIAEYDSILQSLISGNAEKTVKPLVGSSHSRLLGLELQWNLYREKALLAVVSDINSEPFRNAYDYVSSVNETLLGRANEVVSDLDQNARQRADSLMTILVMLLFAGVFVFAFLVWAFVNTLKPLKELTRISDEVAMGNFSTRISFRSKDEIGRLAFAFDSMIQKIGHQVNLLEMTVSKLEEARIHAEQDLEAKSEFLAVMSHEIRAPLNGIIGMTTILNETSLNSEQKQFAETACLSGRALIDIINSVLDYSKIEADKLEIAREEFDIRQCVKESLNIVSYSASTKGLTLQEIIDPNLQENMVGDSVRLRQVFVNLLSNAIKFTDSGYVSLSVKQLLGAKGTHLLASVADTGIGMDEDEARNLFNLYSQGNSMISRNYGGTGLGLAISRKLVEAMGGEIWIESEKGVGTTFYFTVASGAFSDA